MLLLAQTSQYVSTMPLWAFLAANIGILTVVSGISLLALDERARRKFVSKETLDGVTQRFDAMLRDTNANVERVERMLITQDDRLGAMEREVLVLTERQTQQWGRIADQLEANANVNKDVMERIERTSASLHQLALRLEAIAAKVQV